MQVVELSALSMAKDLLSVAASGPTKVTSF